jgi:hypothetical protein
LEYLNHKAGIRPLCHKIKKKELRKIPSYVIRLDFVPFGYFLALSVSFPKLYALS